jgi:membrane carboxypeptidase/penicillin-binding protein
MSLGDRQTGAVVALPITAPFMRMAVDTLHIPPVPFERPPGIVDVNICMDSKKLANDYCPNVITDICDVRYLPTTCDIHGADKGNKASPQQKRRVGY